MEITPVACVEQQRLIDEVMSHLLRIAELSRETATAVEHRNDDLTRELDKQVESEIGKKERSLGRLRQHREDHGC